MDLRRAIVFDDTRSSSFCSRRLTGFVVTVALFATACGGTSPPAATACDPLATTTLPISAGKLVAAGKDAAGTVYVIDESASSEGAGTDRLFISDGTVLQRQTVDGSGAVGSGAGSILIVNTGSSAGAQALQVEVEMGPSGPAKMAIHRGPLSGKTFAIDTGGEPLTLLTQADLATFSLQNLPGTVVVEHNGQLADGRVVLVTSPEVDASYQDFRVFFGTIDHLLEGTDVHVSRGSFTQIAFTWDGHAAAAVFGSQLAPSVVSALTIDGQTFPLTVAPAGSPPAGATYFCTPTR